MVEKIVSVQSRPGNPQICGNLFRFFEGHGADARAEIRNCTQSGTKC